jgi:UDP-N-acetylglucosamine 2-epimerase (non-hydrolysing)
MNDARIALKVLTIVGTRPEIIRLSRVIPALDAAVEHRLVHTGQNYDYALNGVFFDELGLRAPDHVMSTGGGTLGELLGGILVEAERILSSERPDAVLILGDTNSSIAAIMAKRLQIPVYHMEAGNRCFDANVPEELNRRIIDHISDFNLVYTEHARRHLLSEGLPHRRVYLTGSPLKEVLDFYSTQIDGSTVLDRMGLEPQRYLVVSLHREENVDSRANLALLIDTLNQLVQDHDLPLVVSTHPRTRDRLRDHAGLKFDARLLFNEPFGFFDYNKLQKSALCVLSDSGTVSEESATLSFPAVTVRRSMERPEALDTGGIILTGLDPMVIRGAVRLVVEQRRLGRIAPVPAEYRVENVSQRVVNLIVGTAKLSNGWDGIEPHDYRWRKGESRRDRPIEGRDADAGAADT